MTTERLLLIGNRIRANWYLSFNCHENVIAREIERSRTDFARLEAVGRRNGGLKRQNIPRAEQVSKKSFSQNESGEGS
jgi:hypothetical protein